VTPDSVRIDFEPASLAVIPPARYQPATAADAAGASELFAQSQKACDSRDPVLFYSLYTERVRIGFSRQTRAGLATYMADWCNQLPGIAAQIANGASISSNSYSKEDDQFISNLCPASPDGSCHDHGVDVGIEGGKLKFSEH